MDFLASLRLHVSFGWLGITVIAGVILLLVAYAFLKDKEWAFPVALVCLATLPIGSFYVSSFAGYMVRKKVFAPSFTAFVVGLVAFWALILLEKKGKDLWASIIPLTLLGMFGTQAFAFSEHGLRGLYQGGKTASILDPSIGILRYSQPIMVIVLITIFFAIYNLAAKKEIGWWFGIIAGLLHTVGWSELGLLFPSILLDQRLLFQLLELMLLPKEPRSWEPELHQFSPQSIFWVDY